MDDLEILFGQILEILVFAYIYIRTPFFHEIFLFRFTNFNLKAFSVDFLEIRTVEIRFIS